MVRFKINNDYGNIREVFGNEDVGNLGKKTVDVVMFDTGEVMFVSSENHYFDAMEGHVNIDDMVKRTEYTKNLYKKLTEDIRENPVIYLNILKESGYGDNFKYSTLPIYNVLKDLLAYSDIRSELDKGFLEFIGYEYTPENIQKYVTLAKYVKERLAKEF